MLEWANTLRPCVQWTCHAYHGMTERPRHGPKLKKQKQRNNTSELRLLKVNKQKGHVVIHQCGSLSLNKGGVLPSEPNFRDAQLFSVL